MRGETVPRTPTPDSDSPAPTPEPRQPYEQPALRVFGTVTAITAQFARDKGAKDGGPNNFKT